MAQTLHSTPQYELSWEGNQALLSITSHGMTVHPIQVGNDSLLTEHYPTTWKSDMKSGFREEMEYHQIIMSHLTNEIANKMTDDGSVITPSDLAQFKYFPLGVICRDGAPIPVGWVSVRQMEEVLSGEWELSVLFFDSENRPQEDIVSDSAVILQTFSALLKEGGATKVESTFYNSDNVSKAAYEQAGWELKPLVHRNDNEMMADDEEYIDESGQIFGVEGDPTAERETYAWLSFDPMAELLGDMEQTYVA